MQRELLPVVGAAVVEHVAGAVRNDTGGGVGRELRGGSEVPGWRRAGPGGRGAQACDGGTWR